jgi:hypothetical protein
VTEFDILAVVQTQIQLNPFGRKTLHLFICRLASSLGLLVVPLL